MSTEVTLRLERLPGLLAVCRLTPDAPVPAWVGSNIGLEGPAGAASGPTLLAVVRTDRELSIVAPAGIVPPEQSPVERDWLGLRVIGTLDFALVGILARLTSTLAAAAVPVFALSTFDTDILLVKAERLDDATDALQRAGIEIQTS